MFAFEIGYCLGNRRVTFCNCLVLYEMEASVKNIRNLACQNHKNLCCGISAAAAPIQMIVTNSGLDHWNEGERERTRVVRSGGA